MTVNELYDLRVELMVAEPCEDVEAFAARMVAHSWTIMGTVLGEHNQHTLECRPGQTRSDVLRPWHAAQRRSYCEGK